MDENAYQALMIAFGLFVFVIAITLTMYMLSKLSTTAEVLTFFADKTNYYDNVEITENRDEENKVNLGIERYVNTETVIPTLYRYYKEHFCVKIYDAADIAGGTITKPVLVQILDVSLEGEVSKIAQKAVIEDTRSKYLNKIYNTKESTSEAYKYLYLFQAPWLDSTDNMKLRLDFLINGDAGYINNQWVDYTKNPLHEMIEVTKNDLKYQFKEKFISYSYTGETMTTEDGDLLITGSSPKDKIVITYTLIKITDTKANQAIDYIEDSH